MDTLVREAKYIKSDHVNNNNKFWYIFEFNDSTIVTEYGRVGMGSQSRTKSFTTQFDASKFFDKKCKEKERSGRNGEIAYRPLKVLDGQDNGESKKQVTVTQDLASVAQKEIDSDSVETMALIRYFTKVNIHTITSGTTMTYNKQSGLFETPLGVVTQDGVDEARDLLVKMSDYVAKNDLDSSKYGSLLNDYMMIIPQDIGMKRFDAQSLFPDLNSIQSQNNILDSLDATLKTMMNNPSDGSSAVEKIDKVFNTKLHRVTDSSVVDRIISKYKDTRKDMHVCSHLKVKTVYEVDIKHMKNDFEERGSKVGNVMELWHGTRAANVLSMLKCGMVIPPSSSSHCTGRLFGNGAYFASDSTKSLNYSYGYWGHGNTDSNCFMFLADVAMGKYYVPRYGDSLPKSGYDSTWAKPNKSGIRNDEYIVYSTDRCNLKYLIEFG